MVVLVEMVVGEAANGMMMLVELETVPNKAGLERGMKGMEVETVHKNVGEEGSASVLHLPWIRSGMKNTSFSSRYLFFVCDFMILCTGYFFPI
jgi:hypothetical protein